MNVNDLLLSGGGLLLLLTFIEITPIKLNPWKSLWKLVTFIWKALGKAFNASLLAELEAIRAEQRETRQRLDAHIAMDDERNADAHRLRILRFNNELLRDIPHTREDFIEALAEIDFYEDYCEAHPKYQNNRAVLAISHIKKVYNDRLDKHDFL